MNVLLKIPPPVYALLTLILCRDLSSVWPLPLDLSSPVLGYVMASVGLALVFWAWLHFLLNKTTPIPTGEPSALVTGGPYRFSRNPMYLGVLMMLASAVLFTGSLFYLLSPLGFFWIVDRLFIPYEESKLGQLFGTDFSRFMTLTRRWW